MEGLCAHRGNLEGFACDCVAGEDVGTSLAAEAAAAAAVEEAAAPAEDEDSV